MVVLCIVLIPLTLVRELSSLRYVSVMILVIVFFTIGVSIFQAPSYYEQVHDNPKYHTALFETDFSPDWFMGFGTMLLSYNCQITIFYVRGELKHKSKQRVRKVLRNLICIECIFYLLISIAGYASLGRDMLNPVFTLRKNMFPDSGDYLMKFTQCIFLVAAITHIPITLFPARA